MLVEDDPGSDPLAALPRLSRREARLLTAWARASPLRPLERGGRAARAWLGVPIALSPEAPSVGDSPPTLARLPSALLLRPDGPPAGLVLDATIAAALVDRTLGGEGEVAAAAGPFGDVERGVLAYALARWLGGGHGWRVADVFAHPAAVVEARVEPVVRWPLSIAVGAARGVATLWLHGDPPAPTPATPPETLGELPLAVSAVGGWARLSARELSSLRPGDAIVPDRLDLRLGADGPEGRVTLTAKGARLGVRCTLAAGALTVEATAVDAEPRGPTVGRREGEMSDDAEGTIEAMGETPVTLSVEVARFELPLAEVGALARGEVLSTGAPVGAEVTLRAGDRVVARGELVEIEGELGIRVRSVFS